MSFSKSMAMRRKEKDIFKLRSAGYDVVETEQTSTWNVEFKGLKWTRQDPRTLHMSTASGA